MLKILGRFTCPECGSDDTRKSGPHTVKGGVRQRWACNNCSAARDGDFIEVYDPETKARRKIETLSSEDFARLVKQVYDPEIKVLRTIEGLSKKDYAKLVAPLIKG
jgi:hypothetical protein